MNTIDLNAYGVQQMSHQEMVETNGGIFPIVIWGIKITAKKAAAALVGGTVVAGMVYGYVEASQQ